MLLFRPSGGGEGDEKGEDLKTSQQHGGREQQLSEGRIGGKVGGGAKGTETGADVVEAGRNGGEGAFKVKGFKGQQQ